jgi:outer membrane cobalamin receptor
MDYFSNLNQNNVVTGKLGMNVKPFGKIDLSFKTTIGNNFSAPTFNELYWKDIGNKDLKPERSISFDAGLIYRFDFALLNEIELSYYSINTINRIVWTPVSGIIWRPINVGRVNSEGIDISLSSKLSLHRFFNVLFNFNYSFGNAVKKNKDFPGDPSYNKQLLYIPKEMVKSALNLNYLPTSKFIKFVSFNLFYSYNTRRYTNVENTVFTPRYDVFDANLAAGFVFPVLEMNVKFAVNNILNEDYQVISGYPMPLRNYRFEIIFKY